MSDEIFQAIQSARYISLVTFRRDGREVATPVWFVASGNRLQAYTAENSGKVKRIRATSRVRVAPCTISGKVTGAWAEGTGRIVEEPRDARQVYRSIARKYGLAYLVTTALAGLTGKRRRRAVLEFHLGVPGAR